MSGVYWGIVVGLVAMVATLFACLEVSYSKPDESPETLDDRTDKASEAGTTQTSGGHRTAA
jgi:hypothetical protein